ncbi:sugar ABC transporter substrate-binding protein [Solirubrobacter soli]|uniref:sugar ABC transporter substrate-binding protein n=1 Tax=Solirubrobacter soli TaxID=363832 RepID=UPI00040345B9|nr:sugar ABC transporter substrate-binding protein [Solirubrobacter soli]
MSELDPVHDALERLEWAEGKQEQTPVTKWRAVTRRTALTGGAAGLAAAMLGACGSSGNSSKATATAAAAEDSGQNVFGSEGGLKFTLVNHVTTNPFFVPTKYGAEDACKLLGCSYQWTGSENANVNEMANAMNTAITGGSNGIGVCLVDKKAFNAPTDAALKAKIPVVAYNADEPNNRLCYIGQDLFLSGQEMGKKIIDLVPSGDVALFIATPGASNIQPRIDGAQDVIKKSGKGITTHVIATGAAVPAELSVIDAYAQGHPETKGYFAVDAGSTQSIAQTMQKHDLRSKGVKAGGYDLTPITQKLLAADQLDFTIDQQPYLQGFIPILQLFMYQASQTLSGIADTNTGLKFLDKTTVAPYNDTKSRYEGTSDKAGVAKA